MENDLIEKYNNLKESKNVDLESAKELLNEIVNDFQNRCLKSEFDKVINSGLDVGIKIIFPSFLDDQIINLKNNLYEYGVKEGFEKTINDSINMGKTVLGIQNNNFEDISQVKEAIEVGKTIDGISNLLDKGINNLKKSKVIDKDVAKTLKEGKNEIIKNIEKNIDNSFSKQITNTEKLEKHISNWQKDYNQKNFEGMEKEFNKMEKIMKELIPMENTFKNYRNIENLQNLIKNNGKNFNLSQEEIDLANKLNYLK